MDDNSWRANTFRQSVVNKIEDAICQSGVNATRNSLEMESFIYLRAKNKEEYLGYTARLILHIREMRKTCNVIEDIDIAWICEKVTNKKPPKLAKVIPINALFGEGLQDPKQL